ncbi:regulator of telomere elongation helicase 1, partial [Monoraphidium neglectum]
MASEIFLTRPDTPQIDYMRKVILALDQEENALLESPTGTGKTLCLLCATLAWREAWGRRNAGRPVAFGAPPPEPPLVIYSSRTHSQLAQVIRELRSTSYRRGGPPHLGLVRTTVLGSRQQMCLHPRVSKMTGGHANFACRGLVHHRQCQWHNKQRLERTVQDITTPQQPNPPDANAPPASAPGTAGAFGALGGRASGQAGSQGGGNGGSSGGGGQGGGGAAPTLEPPDIEDLLRVGRAASVCPYFLSRDLVAHCDVVFMPYNYLLDSGASKQLDTLRLENAIVIFDEAHNVQ